MNFTVFGAGGFIGRHLVAYLDAQGHQVFAPERDDAEIFRRPLGHVIYCIGVTADFRRRPLDTVRAHVSVLADVLERADFESLLYLSSTRVYAKSADASETSVLQVDSADPSDLYNLSKLMGESLCLNCGRQSTRIARISNVAGFDADSDNFLSVLVREALAGKIILRSDPASAKDYIALEDVVALLPRIALQGRERIYNVASGTNTTNATLTQILRELSGCMVETAKNAPHIIFPIIDTARIRNEFGYSAIAPFTLMQNWASNLQKGAII